VATHPDLVAGISDDAGVFRISDGIGLVQSVDFFTPIDDDPFDWGRIAAANALSDIYAMGGTPLTALQLVSWPRDALPFDLLGSVLEGGAEVLGAAGCTIVGGHSIDDPEPKYGFAVTGLVDPAEMTRNSGGASGDCLVLTKPVGTGLIATGVKRGVAPEGSRNAAVESMTALNEAAARSAASVGVSAVTDVTGFGLLGHLQEMLGDVGAMIESAAVPVLPGAQALAAEGVVPGGTRRNLDHVSGFTDFGPSDEATRLVLADAQTSGGLLIAVAEERCRPLMDTLEEQGAGAWQIGLLTAEHPGRIVVE